jgi:hypothetical protein
MSTENLFNQQLVTGEKITLRNVGTGQGGSVVRKDDIGFAFRSIKAGAGIQVKNQGDDIVITNSGTLQQSFLTLIEAPTSFTGANGKFLSYNSLTTKLEFTDVPPNYGSFLNLSDTPNSYTNVDGQFLKVNGTTVGYYDLEGIHLTPLSTRLTAAEGNILALQEKKIVTVASVPPADEDVNEGDFWFDSEDGTLYIRYTATWVETGSAEPVLPPVSTYDYGGSFEGTPTANQVIYRWRPPVGHTLADEFAGCTFTCETAPSATFSCKVFVNGTYVGDWHISTAKNSVLITLDTEVIVPPHAEVKIVAPAVAVTGITGITMAFLGERQ